MNMDIKDARDEGQQAKSEMAAAALASEAPTTVDLPTAWAVPRLLTEAELTPAGRNLLHKIRTRTARVAVIGAGYVGLPLAVEKGKVGFDTICIDQNPARVAKINRGENYILDVKPDDLKSLVAAGRLRATSDFSVLADCDIAVMCVPTPLTPNYDPDISYIENVSDRIAEFLHPGMLVSLESTTYPGTTEEVVLPKLATSGLTVGEDFFLAFSPERVDPGNKRYTTHNTNKLVGGVTPACLTVAYAFYSQTILKVIPVSSPRVAEMAKVFENTYRAVNIALVNEMALLCDRMGISVWEMLDAAFTKPFGIQPFYPGPGVGGHCIPIDPFYLTWKARQYDYHTRFIELAGEINLTMPYFVVQKLTRALGRRGKPLTGSHVLALGVAYKKDLPDERESPAIKVISLLQKEGCRVSYHDPFIPAVDRRQGVIEPLTSIELTQEAVAGADAVLILTDHSSIDYAWIVEHAQLVMDTRGVTRWLGISQGQRGKVVYL